MTDPTCSNSCDHAAAPSYVADAANVGDGGESFLARVEFRVEDMDCASCLDTIRRGMERRDGIAGVEGSPISRRLEIDYDPRAVDTETIRR